MERFNTYVDRFEKLILMTLTVFVAIVVLAATISMGWLMVERLLGPGHLIEHVDELPEIFGAFLMVLIAALIAMGRKIIVFEPDAHSTDLLLGIAAIILALGVTLYLWARVESNHQSDFAGAPPETIPPAPGQPDDV